MAWEDAWVQAVVQKLVEKPGSAQKSSSWPGKGDKEKLDPCLNIQDLVPSGLLVQGHSANVNVQVFMCSGINSRQLLKQSQEKEQNHSNH